MPDAETETNPIDRTVAHLLFHRPLGTGFSPENCPSKQTYKSHQHGPKIPCVFADEGDRSKTSPCVDASEDTSNTEAADGGAMEVQVSK